jgi:hypothetical protein
MAKTTKPAPKPMKPAAGGKGKPATYPKPKGKK